ncbi:MAG TPA: helix-turn-helix domain-containing protein [Clostridia bacterium]|nr:helix-turn-helix domain-containing protein [Clostridia bacterium]
MKKGLMESCPENVECSIEKALAVLEGKWTFLILRDLFEGTKRFGELRKSLHGISPKTLTERLKMLEMNGILERTVYPTIPPAVEYTLTEKGESLKPIIIQMKLWGAKWG